MMASSREVHESKQEGDDETFNIPRLTKASSSSIPRQWSGFKNPRIVRVSRSFGGKDRHSKVCTIRGLRDRRIRLSVPTAVQLYDLQDKLGLNQPSKVVDWLLEATKLDIDKLPPLQFPQGFSQFHDSSNASDLSLGPFYDYTNNFMAKSRFSWDLDSMSRVNKGKEAAERGKWIKTSYDHENRDGVIGSVGVGGGYNNSFQVSTQKLFPNTMSYNNNNYHSSEPSSLSLSQFGSHGGLFHSHSQLDPSHPSSVQFPSSNLPLLSGSQFLFAPTSSVPTPPSFFTPFMTTTTTSVENDPRQFNHFQFLNSSGSSQHLPHPLFPSLHSLNSTPIRPFATPFNSKLLDSNNDNKDSNTRS